MFSFIEFGLLTLEKLFKANKNTGHGVGYVKHRACCIK